MPAYGNFVLDKGKIPEAAIAKYCAVIAGAVDDGVAPATAADDVILGVAQHSASTDEIDQGKRIGVRMMGITEWVAGDAVTVGVEVTIDTAGKCVEATSGDRVYGVSLQGCDDEDDRIAVFLGLPGYIMPA